jgi:hypothetical protein
MEQFDDARPEVFDGCMTLDDAYLLGDDEARQKIDRTRAVFGPLVDKLRSSGADARLVARPGCRVFVSERRGSVTVHLDVFRPGPAYGSWTLRCSPEEDRVHVEHCFPEIDSYGGGPLMVDWSSGRSSETWDFPVDVWRKSPVGCFEKLVGTGAARAAAPRLPLPDHVAPDAQVGQS